MALSSPPRAKQTLLQRIVAEEPKLLMFYVLQQFRFSKDRGVAAAGEIDCAARFNRGGIGNALRALKPKLLIHVFYSCYYSLLNNFSCTKIY